MSKTKEYYDDFLHYDSRNLMDDYDYQYQNYLKQKREEAAYFGNLKKQFT